MNTHKMVYYVYVFQVEQPEAGSLPLHVEAMKACHILVSQELRDTKIEDRPSMVFVYADKSQYQIVPLDEVSADFLKTAYGYNSAEAAEIILAAQNCDFTVNAPVIISDFTGERMNRTFVTMEIFPGSQMQMFPISDKSHFN